MKINVLLFASLHEHTGLKNIELELPVMTTVGELKDIITTHYPSLSKIKPFMIAAINKEFALDDQIIPSNAEIALFPPVSGG